MFDWFWNFLYLISKSIFNLIDQLMKCANMLCGIEPIYVEGEETSFVSYLLSNEQVSFGFRITALMGTILVGAFALFGIIRAIVNEKNNTTPVQVVGKATKTILTFFFVPACMMIFIYVMNVFVEALYRATLGGGSGSIGNFLCGAFSQTALKTTDHLFYTREGFDYMSTGKVREFVDLTEFDYFFSWISSICILIALAKSLLMFVDRAISIVLLYLFAPISMSASVIDDGAHFKLWRDQVFTKFFTGYGCIIGLNIYMLIISLISSDRVIFFPDSYILNNIAKIAFILGGSVSLQRVMALVGNLISAGAGSNELRDNAIAAAGFRGAASALGGAMTAPFRGAFNGARGIANFARDTANRGLGNAVGSRLGFRTDRDYGIRSEAEQKREAESKRREHEQLASMIGSKVSDAISGKSGGGDGTSGNSSSGNSSGGNTGPTEQKKAPLVDNAISNSIAGSVKEDKSSNKK